jgi:hypothetical protein
MGSSPQKALSWRFTAPLISPVVAKGKIWGAFLKKILELRH